MVRIGQESRFVTPALLITATVALMGCTAAKESPEAADQPPPPCEGPAVLIVQNNSGREIEIVEVRRLSGGRHVVAVLGPGRHEISARPEREIGYAARAAEGGPSLRVQRLNPTGRTRVPLDDIKLTKVCRDSGSGGLIPLGG